MAPIDVKTVFQNIVIGLLMAAGLFFSILILNYSWIKILVLSLTLGCGVIWLVSHGKLKKALKYLVFSLMIFGICFTSLERHIFWNAGYPSTYNDSIPDVTISYPSILNVSLTELVQSAEETAAFNLFELEHLGETTFESIALSTSRSGGRIDVTFYNEDASIGFFFTSSGGYHYHTRTMSWIGPPPSQIYSQQQTPEEALRQMDNLGLQWFYDRVSEMYQNRTGTTLNASTLDVSTEWQEYNEYRGMILQMIGDNGMVIMFTASFLPHSNQMEPCST